MVNGGTRNFLGGGHGAQPYFYSLYLNKCSMVIGNIKNLKYMGVLAVVTPLHLVVLNLIIHGKKNIIYIVLIITTMCLN